MSLGRLIIQTNNLTPHDGRSSIESHQPRSYRPVHHCYEAQDGFQHLQAHVEPRAYATQQEGDAPKCHQNTRIAVINDIMYWITLQVARIQWAMWVYGAAGAGKSSIARSVVEMCLSKHIPVARFFILRTDSTRNTLTSLVATLCNQLIQQIPGLSPHVIPQITSDPHVFEQSLETQLENLIFGPLRLLHADSPLSQPVVILCDGIDELIHHEEQTKLIDTLFRMIEPKEVPIIALLFSRAEHQIQYSFRTARAIPLTRLLPLDNHYLPDLDIELFVNDKFTEIKTAHSFRSSLPAMWPDRNHVLEIVQKSSGQFIYASVAMKFISDPRRHPLRQLDIIRGIQPARTLKPFAQLDAIYTYLFSQVEDLDRVFLILAFFLISGGESMVYCCKVFGFSLDDIHLAFIDLASVIKCEGYEFAFLHASLPDFLGDPTRAGAFYLERPAWCARIAIEWLRAEKNPGIFPLKFFLPHANCTEELKEAVRTFDPPWAMDLAGSAWAEYLSMVEKLDFRDEGETYRHQVHLRVIAFKDGHRAKLDNIMEAHDLSEWLPECTGKRSPRRQDSYGEHPMDRPIGSYSPPPR